MLLLLLFIWQMVEMLCHHCTGVPIQFEGVLELLSSLWQYFFNPMPPHVLMDFVVFPPGHGSSVTDF
jgi:hypothetical protein